MTQIDFKAKGGERLDRAVARELRRLGHDVSNRQAKTFVEEGAVAISGRKQTRASWQLEPGDVVRVTLPDVALEPDAPPQLVELGDRVIFRDDFILVIDKPAGLPTHATHDPNRDHAHAAVERVLGVGAYVAVHHRLDVDTSGVLVFGIDRAANKGLADAFAQRLAKKTYAALTTPSPARDSFDVENHLGRDRHQRERMCAVRSGGDFARTTFAVLARANAAALVEASPETGRKHQIRAHLSGIGAPIVGDVVYGGVKEHRVMLHARRLVLPHPVTGERLELTAALPHDFLTTAKRLGVFATE